jgi:DNA-binding MarR family transcriptional regulator
MVSHATPPLDDAPLVSDRAARQVLDAIRRIVRALRKSSRATERSVGLSAAQVFVLHRLAGAPAFSLNELAQRTLTHQSSVSVVVTKLVKRGLVDRTTSTADGRRVEISLTQGGRDLIERTPGPAAQDRLITGLLLIGERRRRALARSLWHLVDAMALSGEPPAMFFDAAPPAGPAKGARRRGARS